MKGKGLILAVAIAMVLFGGCSVSPQSTETSTETLTEYESTKMPETEGTTSTEESENTEEKTEESAEQSLISDSPEKEALLVTLWGRLLQRLDGSAPARNGDTRWERSYVIEAILENFTLKTTKYIGTLVYPEMKWNDFVMDWPDTISNVAEHYQEAEQSLGYYLGEVFEWGERENLLNQYRNKGILRITGEVKNETYAQAGQFTDHLYPYYYYLLWGSVLKEAGKLHLADTGSILGELSGQAYMTDFDFDTLTGTFWICLEGKNPEQVKMTFANEDCREYTLQYVDEEKGREEIAENAWLGLVFDLVTERTAK